VRQASIARDSIFRCGISRSILKNTYDLVEHETLTVDLNRDPLDLTYYHRVIHLQRNHVSLDRSIVEWFGQRVVVKVATL
jgi:hypothetical protein